MLESAKHTISYPDEAYGHFSWGALSGIIPAALGANSEIYQFRNSHASKLARIRRVTLAAAVSTTFFAAGVPLQIDMVKATTWTAAGSGGTRLSPAATLKRRTLDANANSAMANNDIGIISTAALTAGTKTLEANSLSAVVAAGPITLSLSGIIIPAGTVLFDAKTSDGEFPLILANNEGFVIRSVAVPATGTWQLAVNVDWAEMIQY